MRSAFYIASALAIGLLLTGVSYVVDTGCSCGPARGIPFRYVHPFSGCVTGRFVVGADSQNRFAPVFDIESAAYDVALWGVVGLFILRRIGAGDHAWMVRMPNQPLDRTMRSAMSLLLQVDSAWRAPHRRSACR